MTTATLAKIGNEVYQLQRPEIGELREPFRLGQVGSITMPHKRNPELSEHLGTLARVVRANATLALEGMVHEHERDGRAWKTEWLVLPEACLLTAAALAFAVRLLDGLEVDADRMSANLGARGGYPLSALALRALSKQVGKHAAQDALYTATMRGLDANLSLHDALLADNAVVSALEPGSIDLDLDPRLALGAAPAMVDRVLVAARLARAAEPDGTLFTDANHAP
jgi:adenylosuccinate lyase